MMKLFRLPGVRVVLVFLPFYSALILYCKYNFYRDPGSVFFDATRAFIREYTEFREQQAENFIRHVEHNLTTLTKSGPKPDVCATFVTVKRADVDYITNAVGSALEGMTEKERSRLSLNVFFANTNPKDHQAWDRPWLNKLTDSAYSYDVRDPEFQTLRWLEETGNISKKAVHDYNFALQRCLDSGARWIAMFEDDIIFADGWYLQTLRSLFDIAHRIEAKLAKEEWMYLRLFNQERSTGWSSRRIGGNNEFLISLGIAIVLCPMLLFARKYSPQLQRHADDTALTALFGFIIPSMVVLFFLAGKASLLPHHSGTYMEKFGCCSQGLVFPREAVPNVINYLRYRGEGEIDVMINQLQYGLKMDRYTVYPVQLQHVGVHSARLTPEDEAQAVWSMAFERHDPEKLKEEHAELVNTLL